MWEIIIGLETHVQLATKSKIFSVASTSYGAKANTQIDFVDLGLPGVLPVLNSKAIEFAIKFGISVNAKISQESIFARKNYFYPDLPKGYQISQFEEPIVKGGTLEVFDNDVEPFFVPLVRAHLEEDAGKSLHEGVEGIEDKYSGIDLNRAGIPLLEIVTEPTMKSAQEAVAYAKNLHNLVMWIGICDGNMQEGSFRIDANVSVRRSGEKKLGTRCEIKNLNSFKFLEKAIKVEASRQIDILENGGNINQETRLYDSNLNETREMRSKENSDDYRYFPDPDLPPLKIENSLIHLISKTLPELPKIARERLEKKLCLSKEVMLVILSKRENLIFFDETLNEWFDKTPQKLDYNSPCTHMLERAKNLANWLTVELFSLLNKEDITIEKSKISSVQLAQIMIKLEENILTKKTAKQLFELIWSGDQSDIGELIEQKGLNQISDDTELDNYINNVLAENNSMISEYKLGKEKALNALVGQVMKKSKGRADAKLVKGKILNLIN